MVLHSLRKVGSRFAFEYFLEVWKPKLVEALKKWLSQYTVEDVKKMVSRSRFPNTDMLDFSIASEYYPYIEKISIERLVEDFIAPARPDLIQALQEMGMPGAKWLVKLRQHLLNKIMSDGQTEQASVPKEEMVMATCDLCGKQWPVPRSEFDSIKECPFCHGGKDEAVEEIVAETPAPKAPEKPPEPPSDTSSEPAS